MEVCRKPAVFEKTTTLRSSVESRAMRRVVGVMDEVFYDEVPYIERRAPEPRAPALTSIGTASGELSMAVRHSAASSYGLAGTGSAVKVPETENGATSIVPESFFGDSSLPA